MKKIILIGAIFGVMGTTPAYASDNTFVKSIEKDIDSAVAFFLADEMVKRKAVLNCKIFSKEKRSFNHCEAEFNNALSVIPDLRLSIIKVQKKILDRIENKNIPHARP